ncbi:MAG: TonB-dependent receptor [Acidobacteria bacterium]|nr:TonB-dependent receptor [Acidobacteriota bacterium]
MKRHSIVIFLFLFTLVYSNGSLTAQGTAILSGTVKDSSGGVLPGATVKVIHLETGATRSQITDDGGRYRFPLLPVGEYEVQTELTGFQTLVRRGITLTIGQEAVVEIILSVGEMTERVEVQAEAPLIETTTSTISGLVDEKKVRDLPLNARSLIELAPLKTGIVFAQFGGTQDPTTGYARKISIAGSRQNASLFQLDGASITDRAGAPGSAAGMLMGVETVREFNVITNAYSAEYGRHTGGVFNAVTKSGTNEIHGSVFEFLRNDNLDARNFFDGADPPEFKRNQFGFALGGPIIKNRTFVFGSYEGLRERLGVTQFFTVPSNDARRGLLPDQRTGQLRSVGIAPNVKPFLDLFPAPNSRDFGNGTAEYIRGASHDTDEDFVTIRFDHSLSNSDSLFGRYTFDDGVRRVPVNLNVTGVDDSRSQYLTLGETKIFSPQLINKFVFSFNRTNLGQADDPREGVSLSSFTRFPAVGNKRQFGALSIRGLSSPGGRFFVSAYEINNYFQFKNDLYYTRGKHSLKFGVDIERRQDNRTQGVFVRAGSYSFLNVEDFLLGKPDSFLAVLSGDAERYFRQTVYGFYVQDDVKLTSRLTVNLGLRYEPTGELTERYAKISTFREDWTKVTGLSPGDADLGNPFFKNPSLQNFAPRIGLAWDPWGDTRTAVRAGWGLFYDQINSKISAGGDLSVLPLVVVRGTLLANRIPVPINFPDAYFTQRNLLSSLPDADALEYNPNQPYVMKWSLDVQREIAANTIVEIGYTGTRGVHLSMITHWNPPVAQVVNGRLFVPPTAPARNPGLGRLRGMLMGASSNYHAFRMEVNRRFNRSLQFQGGYTFSKSTDDLSSTNGANDFANDPKGQARYLDMRLDYALSSFDVRHNLVFNATYDLPGKKLTGVAGRLVGGWGLSAIGRFSNGHPVDLNSGALAGWMRFIQDYPDRNPAVKEVSIDERNPARYYDPAAFLLPVPGFIGNLGRNTFEGPGVANFDLVLTNTFKVAEQAAIQFRGEFFNLFNRTNFGIPDRVVFDARTGLVSPTAGRIRTTSTTSRQIQFGLKVLF